MSTAMHHEFGVKIDKQGRLTFELGQDPPPGLVELARELAASMDGEYLAEADCLRAEDREDLAQRLARLLVGGAS